MSSREEAYATRYRGDKMEDRMFLGNILLNNDYSISSQRFEKLVHQAEKMIGKDLSKDSRLEIELSCGLHLLADAEIPEGRATFLPMDKPFMQKTIDVVRIRLDVAERKEVAGNLDNPSKIAAFMQDFLRDWDREAVCVLCLNTQLQVTNLSIASVGTVDSAAVHPREIFKTAIASSASSIIMVHNHPSGSLTPSEPDIGTTRRIAQCGALLGIQLLDHIIVTNKGYTSIRGENEFLFTPDVRDPRAEYVYDSGNSGIVINASCAQRKTNSRGVDGWTIRFPEGSVLPIDGELKNVSGWQMFVRQAEKSSTPYMLDIPWPQSDSAQHSIYEPSLNGKQKVLVKHVVSADALKNCICGNPEFRKNQWSKFRIRSQFVEKQSGKNGKEQLAVTCPPDTIVQTSSGEKLSISGYRFFPRTLKADQKYDKVYDGSFRKDFKIPLYKPKESPKEKTQKIYVTAAELSTALYEQYQRFKEREHRQAHQEVESEQKIRQEVRQGGTAQIGSVISGLVNAHYTEQASELDKLKVMQGFVFQHALAREANPNNEYKKIIEQSGMTKDYAKYKEKNKEKSASKGSEIEV
ncbi:MAG: JAB domain-containing protein [Eubacterium sp.]